MPRINTLKLSSQGQVTLSKEARDQHGLTAGETLIEISLPGCIILLPQSEVMADLMLRAQTGLAKMGLSVEELKARVAKRREEQLSEHAHEQAVSKNQRICSQEGTNDGLKSAR